MCRWFAYISHSEPCLLEDVLINPKHSLSKQVHEHYLPKLIHHHSDIDVHDQQKQIDARNALFNIDGLGVAWYTSAKSDFNTLTSGVLSEGLRPAMYKTTQPPLNDFNFRSISANTSTLCCFAHIRAASATAIASVNNHPFIFGRHTFMHNGVVSNFVQIQRQLSQDIHDDAFENIHGSTDSEHLAALYITYLTKDTKDKGRPAWEQTYGTHAMVDAMQRVIQTVIQLQNEASGTKRLPNSLNLAATDGQTLVTCRFRNHKTEEPPSLYVSTTAGVNLNRKYPEGADGSENPAAVKAKEEHEEHVIVASEPSTYKASDWELIKKNHILTYDTSGVKTVQVKYEDWWDAEDPQ